MKKILMMAAMFFAAAGFVACGESDGPVDAPILSATAKDMNLVANATIDNAAKTIDFGQFQKLIDVSKVEVTFTLAEGVIMKSPLTTTATLDLTSGSVMIRINNMGEDQVYTVKATPRDMPNPVISAKVGTTAATIDGMNITVPYAAGMDVANLALTLELEDTAEVKAGASLDLEFAEEGKIVVEFYENEFTYTVKLSGYTNAFVAAGWTDVTDSYYTTGKKDYIRVFENNNANGREGNKACMVVVGKEAQFDVLGGGTAATKNILATMEADGNAHDVYQAGVVSSCYQIYYANGDNQNASKDNNSEPCLGRKADGTFAIELAQVFSGKIYSFPFRTSGGYVARDVKDGTVWDVTVALGGVQPLVWNGKAVTEAESQASSGRAIWYDGVPYARAAWGVTKSGKAVLFASQQVNGSNGQTVEECAALFIGVGCDRAAMLEGSGTPSMYVNAKETIKNKNADAGLKAVQYVVAAK